METELNALVADTLHISPDQVKDDLTMADVESWDSLTHMDLVASLERNFGVEFTFEEIVRMQSMLEIKNVLRGKGVAV